MSSIQFGAARPPVATDESAITVPVARYTSREFLELERDHLFRSTWLVAGIARDVSRPGDHFVFELGGESILVVCDANGKIGAFHNVCMHRGHTLADPGLGHCDVFVCPYHDWRWGIDGSLASVPQGTRFALPIPEERRRLPRVACEIFAGLVWICIGEPRQSLVEYLGPIHEHVGRYAAEEMHVSFDWTAEWACNWKNAIDGFNETYHGPATHPQFAEFLDTLSAEFQFADRHSVFIIEHGMRPASAGSDEVGEPFASLLRRRGLDPAAYKGRAGEARADLFRAIRERGAQGGHDYSRLRDEQLTDTHHFYVFPNVHIDFHGANEVTIQRFRPHATDPGRCYVDCIDLKRLSGEYMEARPAHEHVPLGGEQKGIVYAQDIERLSRIQRGMQTSGFKSAFYSLMERRIYHMHLVIDSFLGEHLPAHLRATVVPLSTP